MSRVDDEKTAEKKWRKNRATWIGMTIPEFNQVIGADQRRQCVVCSKSEGEVIHYQMGRIKVFAHRDCAEKRTPFWKQTFGAEPQPV